MATKWIILHQLPNPMGGVLPDELMPNGVWAPSTGTWWEGECLTFANEEEALKEAAVHIDQWRDAVSEHADHPDDQCKAKGYIDLPTRVVEVDEDVLPIITGAIRQAVALTYAELRQGGR